MRKLLVSIDGHSAAKMQSAVAQAIAIYQHEPVEIHLLNVQAAVTGHVAMFFDASELRNILQEQAQVELAPALAMLAAASVPCTSRVVIGRNAPSIAGQAKELGCDRIIIGQDDSESFVSKMFGSLVSQVQHIVGVTGNCQVLGS